MAQFVQISPDDLPKRRTADFDQETANALLAASADGNYASDGQPYKTEADARKVAAKMKRLLSVVTPAGEIVKSRVFTLSDGKHFGWGITRAVKPTEEAAES